MVNLKTLLLLLFCILLQSPIVFAQQKDTTKVDTRSKNRKIADSLYYIHTLKKQEDSIKKNENKANKLSIKELTENNKTLKIATNKDIPCATLYQNTWFSERVKTQKVSLKDMPDELSLRLTAIKGHEKFCFPYKGIKTSGYGWRWGRPHTGIDIALNTGDKIYAAFDGVVRVAKFNGGYGNMVLIRHYNNLETLYGHMSKILVKPGQIVKAGDVIGLGGSTGRSTGPHLHFECRLLYACFDPEWIIDMKTYSLKTKFVRIDKSYFGIPASQSAADKKNNVSKLTKVHKLLDGTKYLSKKELNKMIAESERQSNMPAKINNDDKSTWRYYHVKSEDSLESISEKFNITIDDLITINDLKKRPMKVGDRIRIR